MLTTTRVNTDFVLEQDLSFLVKGLRASAMISWDNVFVEAGRGVNDLNHGTQTKWIDPETGEVHYSNAQTDSKTGLDFQEGILWSTAGGEVIKNADCGWNVSAGDSEELAKLVIMLSKMSKSELQEKGRKGREYYDKFFTKDECLKNLDKIMGL